MPAGKEAQPECFSQTMRGGFLNCSCSGNRDLTAINPAVPEVVKIAALAVSTAHIGNMSFAFSKSVPTVPAKGHGKRLSAWTNRRVNSLAPCGFSDTKTANRDKKPSIRKSLAAAKDKAKQLNAARGKVKKMNRGREI